MFENSSWGLTATVVAKGLDASMLRQEVYSNNLANLNTPGFKRDDVVFESELRRALYGPQPIPANRTMPKHFKFKGEITVNEVKPGIFLEKDTFSRNDENNVDLNEEMANLTKNELMYSSLTSIIKTNYRTLRNVIKSGGSR
ncbi:MAG TPA: flagellar basal body rod protein FlgB [bacterium]|nr:flagellar basal body rod protein FlgB [bacterium]HOL46661.1 flagellar basal body rod protein FlgB [bacterium]HPQ18349.1 flagellar basal body rod protein FlgB [bacterium]